MGVGSEKTGENICRKGRSRRVADVNLLHPDEAKSKGVEGRRVWLGGADERWVIAGNVRVAEGGEGDGYNGGVA